MKMTRDSIAHLATTCGVPGRPPHRPFGVHAIGDIYQPGTSANVPNRGWCHAVALPYDGNRLVAAWWVLTGRAYAFVWPKAGDLERVIIGDHATQPDAPEERKRA